jgi:hypothetical protein
MHAVDVTGEAVSLESAPDVWPIRAGTLQCAETMNGSDRNRELDTEANINILDA